MKNVLVTGGAGFIGTNLCLKLKKLKCSVTAADNLSRKGTPLNLKLLKKEGVKFNKINIREKNKLRSLFKENKFDTVFHLAGQVAVTTSVDDPESDFYDNALGGFNVLEAARLYAPKAALVYSSTNKVYGALEGEKLKKTKEGWLLKNKKGIDETAPLDFHSPYGCSKGAADQYFRDYGRIYGLNTIVFRQSCIYGENQFGIEDQGWIAWFSIAVLLNKKITIYGDGCQLRDALYINDLINAYVLVVKNIEKTKGGVYNIGGGWENKISVINFLKLLEKKLGQKIKYSFAEERSGDQKVFISNNTKIKKHTGWRPETSIEKGLHNLLKWLLPRLPEIKKKFY